MYFDTYESIECYKSNSYNFSEDGEMIIGDEEYNEENRQKLSASDLDKIFDDLLKIDVSDDKELLSFISRYGLPCSDAYATLDSLHEFYFAQYFAKRYPDVKIIPPTTLEDFYDVCEITKTRNSLRILQNLASLKTVYDSNKRFFKNSIGVLSSILSILIHFNFEDLFIQLEEELVEIRTSTASFIQHLFRPYIDVETLNPSIVELLEATLCEESVCKYKRDNDTQTDSKLEILISSLKDKKIRIRTLYWEVLKILEDNTKTVDSENTNIKEQYPELFRLIDGQSEPFDFKSLYNDRKVLESLSNVLYNVLNDNKRIFSFNGIYNNKQCFQLLRVVETLLDVCKDMDITLQKLDEILNSNSKSAELEYDSLEDNIKKHLNLHKLHDDDLYDIAATVFTDLLFEGLNLCVPTYQKGEKSTHYKLKIKTILQGLYFHLYQYPGKLKCCPYCNALFETTNKNRIYCSEECGNRVRAKRHYDKEKQSS